MSIAQTNTQRRHVEHAWKLLREAAEKVQSADAEMG